MTMYRITNTFSGADLGTYQADSEQDALDAMAREAGYADYAAAGPARPGEIAVDAVPSLESFAPVAGQQMVPVVTLPAYTYGTPELVAAGGALAAAVQARGEPVLTVPFVWHGGTVLLPATWPEAERLGAAAAVAYALRARTDVSVAWHAEGVVRLDLTGADGAVDVYLSARHLTHANPVGL